VAKMGEIKNLKIQKSNCRYLFSSSVTHTENLRQINDYFYSLVKTNTYIYILQMINEFWQQSNGK